MGYFVFFMLLISHAELSQRIYVMLITERYHGFSLEVVLSYPLFNKVH